MTYASDGGTREVGVGKPFDATTKELLERSPRAWLALGGWATDAPVVVRNVDLSTVSAVADAVFAVEEPTRWLAHLEVQSGRDETLAERILRYNVLLRYDQGLEVRSLAVVLRPEADFPGLTGVYRRGEPGKPGYVEFVYGVVRVWTLPVEAILTGDLATLPLAPIADVREADVPEVIRRMDDRIRAEATPEMAGVLWTSALVLAGLRFEKEQAESFFRGISKMKESTTYQMIVEEGIDQGRLAGLRDAVRLVGMEKFGEPDPEILDRLERIRTRERLEEKSRRIVNAKSWEELMDEGNGQR